jgi:hypothetical protein
MVVAVVLPAGVTDSVSEYIMVDGSVDHASTETSKR